MIHDFQIKVSRLIKVSYIHHFEKKKNKRIFIWWRLFTKFINILNVVHLFHLEKFPNIQKVCKVYFKNFKGNINQLIKRFHII